MNETDGNTTQLQTLLDQANEGDETAYGKLIAKSADRLLHLTRRMLRNYPHLRRWEQTDDVFQRAAMRLYKSLGEVGPSSPREFFGLAGTQVRRTLIDLARHHFGPHGQAAHHDTRNGYGSGDHPAGAVEHATAPNTSPETLEDWTEFHEAIGSLPDDEREAFSFVWYSGVTLKSAGELLEVSERTIVRRLHRARLLLAAQLGHQSDPNGKSN